MKLIVSKDMIEKILHIQFNEEETNPSEFVKSMLANGLTLVTTLIDTPDDYNKERSEVVDLINKNNDTISYSFINSELVIKVTINDYMTFTVIYDADSDYTSFFASVYELDTDEYKKFYTPNAYLDNISGKDVDVYIEVDRFRIAGQYRPTIIDGK